MWTVGQSRSRVVWKFITGKTNIHNRENVLGMANGGGEEVGEMAEGGQKVQTSVTK